jgi:hypothetical protein
MTPLSVLRQPLFLLASCSLLFSQTKPAVPSAPARPAVAPQAAASPQSEKTLRERAGLFLQYTIDHSYSKAYTLVAEDTKDWYLTSGKPQYTKYHVDKVEFSKDRLHAKVTATVTRVLSIQGREVSTELAVVDLWEFVGGKWMWYHDKNVLVTPFGDVRVDPTKGVKVDDKTLPRDMSPEAAEKAASTLSLDATTDKRELYFVKEEMADQDVVLHNGLKGVIRVELDIIGDYRAFSVDPGEAQLLSDGDLKIHVHYKPVKDPVAASLRILIDPFGKTLLVPLYFKSDTAQ